MVGPREEGEEGRTGACRERSADRKSSTVSGRGVAAPARTISMMGMEAAVAHSWCRSLPLNPSALRAIACNPGLVVSREPQLSPCTARWVPEKLDRFHERLIVSVRGHVGMLSWSGWDVCTAGWAVDAPSSNSAAKAPEWCTLRQCAPGLVTRSERMSFMRVWCACPIVNTCDLL